MDGWKHKKRPGLDAFLQQIGPPLYEVVIYTHRTGNVSSFGDKVMQTHIPIAYQKR